MSITPDDVHRIARLARLRINAGEVDDYSRDLTRILGLVAQMEAVDTESIAPMAHPLDVTLRLRPDEVTETSRREDFLEIAPAADQGLYLVPRVIE